MNYIKLFISLCFTVTTLYGANLVTTILAPTSDGQIIIELYNSEETFKQLTAPIQKHIFPMTQSETYTLSNIPEGTYAFIIYLDSNKNTLLDRSTLGIPKESIVFSNNYKPKGPPQFKQASITLTDTTDYKTTAILTKKQSTSSLGIGGIVIGQTSPYTGTPYSITRFFPTLTYISDTVKWFGPFLFIDLLNYTNTSISGALIARFGTYKEQESTALHHLGDRKTSLMSGISIKTKLPLNTSIQSTFTHDVTNVHNGSLIKVTLNKSTSYKSFTTQWGLDIEWISKSLANYEFGVPSSKTTSTRPSYELPHITTITPSLSNRWFISKNWMYFSTVGLTFLPSQVYNSPIVNKRTVVSYTLGINSLF